MQNDPKDTGSNPLFVIEDAEMHMSEGTTGESGIVEPLGGAEPRTPRHVHPHTADKPHQRFFPQDGGSPDDIFAREEIKQDINLRTPTIEQIDELIDYLEIVHDSLGKAVPAVKLKKLIEQGLAGGEYMIDMIPTTFGLQRIVGDRYKLDNFQDDKIAAAEIGGPLTEDELLALVANLRKPVKGSSYEYSQDELSKRIKEVLHDGRRISDITQHAGLRALTIGVLRSQKQAVLQSDL